MISIIIPVYKSEKTLERCIESLLAQTYHEIEIIMIVDGPPDASGVLADTLAERDDRIRVLHQENQGVSAARNAGISAAKGAYIQFVDSDDYVEPKLCECLYTALLKHQADMAVCGFHHWFFGRDVEKRPIAPGTFCGETLRSSFLSLYGTQFFNMPWNKLYRKDKIKELFRRDLNLGEDLLFNLSYLKQVDCVQIIDAPLYHYIQDDRGTTLSTKKRTDRIDIAFLLYTAVNEFCKERFGRKGTEGIAETKLAVEFLDEIENVYFDKTTEKNEKMQLIQTYRDAFERIEEREQIRLKQLDYKIIYYFWLKRHFKITYFLICIRGWILDRLGLRG